MHLKNVLLRRIATLRIRGMGPTRLGIRHSSPQPAFAAASEDGPLADDAPKRLLLMDVMPTLYRSHHALRDRLVTTAGLDTTVMYGLVGGLITLLEQEPAFTHAVAVFDSPGKNFRHELYPDYKADRAPAPASVVDSIPVAKQFIRDLGLLTAEVPGLEADDCIGTLTARGVREGFEVTIASGDKDLEQLIALAPDRVRMLKPGLRGGVTPYGVEEFRKKYDNLEPAQWCLALALMGDASDNVPGVKGIGEKRAIALAKQGDLEFLLDNAATLAPKAVREALSSEEGRSAARLSHRLVAVRTDADQDVPLLRFPLARARLRMPADQGARALESMAAMELSRQRAKMSKIIAALPST